MMGFPKHKNPSPGNEATAPYDFVPLPDKVETVGLDDLPDHDTYDTQRYTGRIEVKLTTASPLYIRTGLSPEDFAEIGKKSFYELNDRQKREVAQFFHTHTNPVIPGSSLRGMLRSMVEIVSYGKVQPVSDRQLIYRAIGGKTTFANRYRERLMREDSPKTFTPLLKAGYIEKHGLNWFIRPAQDIDGVTFSRILRDRVPRNLTRWYHTKNAHKIWFKPGPYTYKNVRGGFIKIKFSDALTPSATVQPGLQAGVHIYSGQINSKKFDRIVYPPNTTVPAIPIPDDMVIAYREQISKEQVKLLGDQGVLQDKQPVFYLMENNNLVFFGHTMMLRLPYPKRPQDFVPDVLQKESDVDFTEAMFGYVKSNRMPAGKARAYAGRIFVTDARLDQPPTNIWLNSEPIMPKILASPKPTSFQLYLTQQKPDPHIYKTVKGATKSEMNLSHYASSSPEETVIRGHKLYWHRGADPDILHLDPQNAPEKQVTKIKPLKPGVSFTFTIHFENFSELELGALWWVLKLGADPNYRLKLGMGKPLGMGAVKTEPTLKLTDRKIRYQSLFNDNDWQKGTTTKSNTFADKMADHFEAHIRENHTDAFSGEERIAQLISLLHFPGPDPEKTKYMELPDFRARRVLPAPLWVHLHYRKKVKTSIYKKFQTVTSTWRIVWNNKKNRSETKMPNGELAVINLQRKAAAQLDGRTMEMVVAKIENGVCYLEEY